MKMRGQRMMAVGALAVIAAAGLGGLAGCVSYANWPPVPEDTALNNPNAPATEEVMMAGLRWVISKYPPEGRAALLEPVAARRPSDPPPDVPPRAVVNLPQGVKPAVYRRVAQAASGPRGGIVPITDDTATLPIYHVGWVRIRGDEAYMTVFRPVTAIGGTPTQATYQEIRLGLRGGLQRWTVDSVRPWAVGSRPAPAINIYVPEPEPGPVVESPAPPKPRDGTFRPQPAAPRPEPTPAATEPVDLPAEPAPEPR